MKTLRSSNDARKLVYDAFAPLASAFSDTAEFIACSADTWDMALATHEQHLNDEIDGPLAHELILLLSSRPHASQSLSALLTTISPVLTRSTILSLTYKERTAILGQLSADIDTLDTELSARAKSAEAKLRVRPEKAEASLEESESVHVAEVAWARGVQGRVASLCSMSFTLLQDLPGHSDFHENCVELCQRLDRRQQLIFEQWVADFTNLLRSGRLLIDDAGGLASFDEEGNMVICYPEWLTTLVHDVKYFDELQTSPVAWASYLKKSIGSQRAAPPSHAASLTVPEPLKTAALDGEMFLNYSIMLKRVAAYYNTMGTEITPCQKPLLLQPLLNFEKLVGQAGSSSISWRDGQRVASFINELQRAAESMHAANHRLRVAHSQILEQVESLKKLDLLRGRDQWLSALKLMRDTVATAIGPDVNPEHTVQWLSQCCVELASSVEVCLLAGLASFHSSLDEMRAELVYSATERVLQFRPALDDVRTAYLRQLKRNIQLPLTAAIDVFKLPGGHSPSAEALSALSSLPHRCSGALSTAKRSGDALIARMTKLSETMQPWMADDMTPAQGFLGRFRSDEEVVEAELDQQLHAQYDFDAAFSDARAKRREVDRLPDLHQLDCVIVNITPLKRSIDGLLRRRYDCLLLLLRQRIAKALAEVEEFLHRGIEALSKPLGSLADIGAAQVHWKALKEGRIAKKATVASLEAECRLVQQAAIGASYDVSDLVSRAAKLPALWDQCDGVMEAFTAVVEQQRAGLRRSVAGQVEQVATSADRLAQRWETLRPVDGRSWSQGDVDSIFTALSDWKAQVAELQTVAQAVSENCASFGLDAPAFDRLTVLQADIERTAATWDIYRDYHQARSSMASKDWVSFRGTLFDLQDFALKWSDQVTAASAAAASGGSSAATAGTQQHPVHARILTESEAIRKAFASLKFVRGECFKEEHWNALFKHLSLPKGVSLETLTVGHFLAALDSLTSSLSWLKELHGRAQGEVAIREALGEVRAWTDTVCVKLSEHVSMVTGTRTPLMRETKELIVQIGDNQSLLQSLKVSTYFKPFADTVRLLESQLVTLDAACTALASMQRRYVYLEPIFSRNGLPSEQGRFNRVQEQFRGLMCRIEPDPRLQLLADNSKYPNLCEQLEAGVEQLDRCQRALADFLEERRAAFPRFYFIGNDDLLEILGQAHKAEVVQAHLKKMFQGISRVQFSLNQDTQRQGDQPQSISAIVSAAGEILRLRTPVTVTADVTLWLATLAEEVCSTLAALLVSYITEPPETPWTTKLAMYPSQVHCLGEQILFTRSVEAALSQGASAPAALATLRSRLQQAIAIYTGTDTNGSALASCAIKALVMDAVRHLEILSQLSAKDVRNVSSWQWQKQLRMYVDSKTGRVVARMVDASIDYSYEYQGNAPKLVHTALTDKCYLVLSQGLAHGYGGNPYGPAGTGKTESVKALAAAVGRQVLVFNCDEGIDFTSMGRILTGIVRCGAWGCFDEFNRLKEDQLSAVSQQIQAIQDAIKNRQPTASLLGKTIAVDQRAGVFVTLNPAGKGYGGRSKLPDNLKQLFRPVAMTAPDSDDIAEVTLQSDGFVSAKELGRKVVTVFKMSAHVLSSQQHYDWGLRAMKVVLNTAGSMLQRSRRAASTEAHSITEVVSPALEAELVVKALRVNTLSKLASEDALRFSALLSDVFPGVTSSEVSVPELEAAIREVMTAPPFSLQFDAGQVKKMLQLQEALDQRIGCVVVGPPGSGKSTIWRVLVAALEKLGVRISTHVLNPKSISRSRLLGEMDHDTREWTDGVLTASARAVVREASDDGSTRSLVVCDGDIDPEWIEALNSVLDDNHLLTLPNGERIAFGTGVNFLFETHSLMHASPATISRMGVVFVSEDDLNPSRLIDSWCGGLPESLRADVGGHVSTLFLQALEWIRGQPTASLTMSEASTAGILATSLSQLSGCKTKVAATLGLVHGFGGYLSLEARTVFAKEAFGWAGIRLPDPSAPLDVAYDENSGTLQQLSFVKQAGEGFTRRDVTRSALVLTPSTQRNISALRPLMDVGTKPLLVVGPQGSGRASLIRYLAASQPATSLVEIHCTSATNGDSVLQKIKQACILQSASHGRVYRPREGGRLILLLLDLTLPATDMYGTSSIEACIHQLVTYQGFYNEACEFVRIERVHIVATALPPILSTRAHHQLAPRLLGLVQVVAVEPPPKTELACICSMYLLAAFGPRPGLLPHLDIRTSGVAGLTRLAGTLVDIYEASFAANKSGQALFSPEDVITFLKSLLRYDPSAESLLDAAAYETRRVFRDRLAGGDDTARFDAAVGSIFRAQWGAAPELRDVTYSSLSQLPTSSASECSSGPPLTRISINDYRVLLQRGLQRYEREERPLGLVLTSEVLDAAAALDRQLSAPGGHALLLGASGCGKRSLTLLIAHMLQMRIASPTVGRAMTLKSFVADLKGVILSVGTKAEPSVLFLEERHIVGANSWVLDVISGAITSGDVASLYEPAELEQLLVSLKDSAAASSEDLPAGEHPRSPYDLFVHNIRRNLRIVLALNPHSPNTAICCERSPSLIRSTATIRMPQWKSDALKEIAGSLYSEFFSEVSHYVPVDAILSALVAVHNDGTSSSSTGLATSPRNFLFLLQSFQTTHGMRLNALRADEKRLSAGLSKLLEAQRRVNELSVEARGQRETLTVKQAAADQAMVEITDALTNASERRREVEVLQKQLSAAEAETLTQKVEIEAQLTDVQPILDAARAAVGGIRKEHLDEIRALKTPPEAIADVLSAVLVMLGEKDTSWLAMKKFLAGRGVKEDIIGFDARSLTSDVLKAVQRTVKAKSDSFDRADSVSKAAGPLAAWVKANITYGQALEQVSPLQSKLDTANAQASAAQAAVRLNEKELAELDERVNTLKRDFSARTGEAELLCHALSKTEDTLSRATSLLADLSNERERWQQRMHESTTTSATLPVVCLMAAAFITYLGSYDERDRALALRRWTLIVQDCLAAAVAKLPSASREAMISAIKSFDLQGLLCSETEALQWKDQKLPADTVTTQNVVSMLVSQKAGRSVLLADSDGACTSWLQRRLTSTHETSPFECLLSSDPRLLHELELAVRFGKTVLIQKADVIEPFMYPLLRREVLSQGGRSVIQLGDRAVDFNDKFRLYLATQVDEPALPPAAQGLLTTLRFTTTSSGLESQVLAIALQHELPELESRKSALLHSAEKLKQQLVSAEESLLRELAESSGNILDNATLLASLQQSKTSAARILESLQEAQAAAAELDVQREVYRPFAATAARIYFSLQGLTKINHMYNFSLSAFLALLETAFSGSREPLVGNIKEPQSRTSSLMSLFERIVLFGIGEGLFKADRLMFAIKVIHSSRPRLFDLAQDKDAADATVLTNESVAWKLLMRSSAADNAPAPDAVSPASDAPTWLPKDSVPGFKMFAAAYPSLARSLAFMDERWARWAQHATPELVFPQAQTQKQMLGPALRLVLVSILRPDRIAAAMQLFVSEILGVASPNPPPSAISQLASSTPASTPILLVTTAGSDPSRELEEVAHAVQGSGQYTVVAMGGGQEQVALARIKEAAKLGQWLCLKNVHLVPAFLPQLDQELSSITLAHPSFRVWLLGECHASFPPSLLQRCRKVTVEAPPGVRNNMMRSLDGWGSEVISAGSVLRAQMLFLLSWFHAVLQERRKYVPQGWTKVYEFSAADLRCGVDVLDIMLPRQTSGSSGASGTDTRVPWAFIHGLMENAVYGGRIDNMYDARVLRAYLAHALHPEVLASQRRVAKGLDLPSSTDIRDFRRLVENMAEHDSPSLFALPANIDRSLHRAAGDYAITCLRSLSEASTAELSSKGPNSAEVTVDQQAWSERVGPLVDFWLRTVASTAEVQTALESKGLSKPASSSKTLLSVSGGSRRSLSPAADPITAFLEKEAAHSVKLIAAVHCDMSAVRAAISDGSSPAESLVAVGNSLAKDGVPHAWAALWAGPPSASPLAWLAGVVRRRVAIAKMASLGASFLSAPIALRDLFHPGALFSLIRQVTCRRLQPACSVDALKLVFLWDGGVSLRSIPGALPFVLTKLHIQGACWDRSRGTFGELREGDEELQEAPDIIGAWIPADAAEVVVSSSLHAGPTSAADVPAQAMSSLLIPLYQASDREVALVDIGVPCGADKARWVLAGAAFVVN